jgi:hypothetical protein
VLKLDNIVHSLRKTAISLSPIVNNGKNPYPGPKTHVENAHHSAENRRNSTRSTSGSKLSYHLVALWVSWLFFYSAKIACVRPFRNALCGKSLHMSYIATVSSAILIMEDALPEPATLSLLGLGLSGLIAKFAMRKNR